MPSQAVVQKEPRELPYLMILIALGLGVWMVERERPDSTYDVLKVFITWTLMGLWFTLAVMAAKKGATYDA